MRWATACRPTARRVEGAQHPDRDAQFEHINRRVRQFLRAGDPVISVDTKKKELVGDFKNGGREWRPQGDPQPVRVHDFLDPELGKAIPYGVYDLGHNRRLGQCGHRPRHRELRRGEHSALVARDGPSALSTARKRLLITADAGGSNGPGCGCGKWSCRRWPTNSG